MGETVVRGVHNAPLDRVAQGGEAGKDDGEVPTALRRGAFKQAVDVFEQHVARRVLKAQEPVDVPPEHTLLANDAACLRQRLCHRVVLAGEAADHHVDVRDVYGARLVGV